MNYEFQQTQPSSKYICPLQSYNTSRACWILSLCFPAWESVLETLEVVVSQICSPKRQSSGSKVSAHSRHTPSWHEVSNTLHTEPLTTEIHHVTMKTKPSTNWSCGRLLLSPIQNSQRSNHCKSHNDTGSHKHKR